MIDVVCDLDGVIYRGDRPVGSSGPALQRLIDAGARLTFVTNNSTRTPEDSAAKLRRVTGVEIDPGRFATSSLAAASMLTETDQPVLVVGETGTLAAVEARRLSITDDPEAARAVVVGMDRALTYSNIATAADAIRNGARFIATNTDPTYPIPSGFLPGAGAVVAAIATAGGREPEVAGKPHPPMRDLVRSLGIGVSAWVIGDRMDTDIAMAADEPGWSSILVLTGVTTADDDVRGADHVVDDFSAAVDLVLSTKMPR